MEPDAAVRRALVRWLSDGVAVQRVVGCAAPSVPVPGESWDLVLANRGFAPAAVKAHVGTGGVGGGVTRVLTHGLFADSDAIFASVSGVSRGYFLQRVLPARLLEPLLGAFAEGRPKALETRTGWCGATFKTSLSRREPTARSRARNSRGGKTRCSICWAWVVGQGNRPRAGDQCLDRAQPPQADLREVRGSHTDRGGGAAFAEMRGRCGVWRWGD
jgi:hypothetical protein